MLAKLSEMSSQLMVKEKELTKLKKDNKLLEKQFRDRKEKRRRETLLQVCYYHTRVQYIYIHKGESVQLLISLLTLSCG